MLDKAAILAKTELATEVIDVAALGGRVTVRELSGSDREKLFNLFIGTTPGHIPENYRATVAVLGLVDGDDGRRMFPDEAVDQVGRLPFDALRDIASAVERLSGIGVDPETAAGNSDSAASA